VSVPVLQCHPTTLPDYEPFDFPLAHTICLVAAHSKFTEGLRTTLNSLMTTDYPNSNKLILVIVDGLVKGSMATPEIVLTMTAKLVVTHEEVSCPSMVACFEDPKRLGYWT
jgi:chitin synthase